MKNHGATTIGPDLPRRSRARSRSNGSRSSTITRRCSASAALLDDAELARVAAAQKAMPSVATRRSQGGKD
jgi:hypothetical protein